MELLVKVDEDEKSCSYYIVDHETEGIFWLDETNTDDFGMSEVSGPDHLSEWSGYATHYDCLTCPF
jgi:hypothetical protein